MKRFIIYSIILISFLVGCYRMSKEITPPPSPEFGIDVKTEKRVREYLSEVERICQNGSDIESIEELTMSQSARLIDLGKAVSPILVGVVQDKTKNWKLRYWACDLLGYIDDENDILPLVAIVEDSEEEEKVRFCALRALAKMGNQEAIEYLKTSQEIVEEDALKEEILKVIEKLETTE